MGRFSFPRLAVLLRCRLDEMFGAEVEIAMRGDLTFDGLLEVGCVFLGDFFGRAGSPSSSLSRDIGSLFVPSGDILIEENVRKSRCVQ